MTKKQPNITSIPFRGKVSLKDNKRKLKLNSPLHFQIQLEKFPLNKEITLWLDSKMPARSLRQNRYLWLYYGIIADDTGEDPEVLHLLFKGLFLETGITEVYGYKVRKVKSTKKLNKSEFTEYLMRIEEKTGIPLPDTKEFNPKTYHNDISKIDYPENTLGKTQF